MDIYRIIATNGNLLGATILLLTYNYDQATY